MAAREKARDLPAFFHYLPLAHSFERSLAQRKNFAPPECRQTFCVHASSVNARIKTCAHIYTAANEIGQAHKGQRTTARVVSPLPLRRVQRFRAVAFSLRSSHYCYNGHTLHLARSSAGVTRTLLCMTRRSGMRAARAILPVPDCSREREMQPLLAPSTFAAGALIITIIPASLIVFHILQVGETGV